MFIPARMHIAPVGVRFDRGDGKHFSKLLGCCWDPGDRSWDEWLECQSNCPYARQRFDELMGDDA